MGIVYAQGFSRVACLEERFGRTMSGGEIANVCRLSVTTPSFRRRPESIERLNSASSWTPASAGVTD